MNDTIENLTNELNQKYDNYGIIGNSACMDRVRKMITKVKDTDATVVITGESGTGKELVAHAVHYSGDRRTASYVEVNCAAIPDGLLESEFFGYRKGAFTGAVSDKQGKFAEADGGTLFLDEVAEMPLTLQAKFLRVLQTHTVTPLGDTKSLNVNVRIVAATNKDLFSLVQQGKFREDLYYRLHVVEINIPPLRERPEDIMALVGFFLSQYAKQHKLPPFHLQAEAQEALEHYTYPGNVRQLFNILEYAALMSSDGCIMPSNLPPEVRANSASQSAQPKAASRDLEDFIAAMRLDELEKLAIMAALKKYSGHKKLTAESLGITDRTLRNKLQEYKLQKCDE